MWCNKNVPDWTGNGSMSYTVPVTSVWNASAEVDYSYIGRSYSSSNASDLSRERPSYRLLDARFAFTDGTTELALVGKNLTNEVTNLGDNRSIAAEVPGRPRLFINQPWCSGRETGKLSQGQECGQAYRSSRAAARERRTATR